MEKGLEILVRNVEAKHESYKDTTTPMNNVGQRLRLKEIDEKINQVQNIFEHKSMILQEERHVV